MLNTSDCRKLQEEIQGGPKQQIPERRQDAQKSLILAKNQNKEE